MYWTKVNNMYPPRDPEMNKVWKKMRRDKTRWVKMSGPSHANMVLSQKLSQWLYWGTRQEPCLPISARYLGELGNCGKFLHQCSLVFIQQSWAHLSDRSFCCECAIWLSLVMGLGYFFLRLLHLWWLDADNYWPHCEGVKQLVNQLFILHQGPAAVSQYDNFRFLAAESRWSEFTLWSVFLRGLSEEIEDEDKRHRDRTGKFLWPLQWQLLCQQ